MRERIACLFLGKNNSIEKIAEACFQFTPQIAIRNQEAVFLEIGKCRSLFGEEVFKEEIRILCEQFNVSFKLKMADDVPSALALARYNMSSFHKLPLQALSDYVSPFGFDEGIQEKVDFMVSTLNRLGIQTLKDFSQIPHRELASRFGIEGLEVSRRIRERHKHVWPRFTPEEKITEKIILGEGGLFEPCLELDPLLFITKNLVDRMVSRLRGRKLRVSRLHLEFNLENYSIVKNKTRAWNFEFPNPQIDSTTIISILRDRLNFELECTPLESPVVEIQAQVQETAPGYASQKNFFHQKEEYTEKREALVARLVEKLGQENVFSASIVDRYLPEKNWKRILPKEAQESLFSRSSNENMIPTRLLKRPLLLLQQGNSLVFVPKKKIWRILRKHGPERISGEWWLDPEYEGFRRDYYQVETRGGEKLWIFEIPPRKTGEKTEIYLHGFFD